MGEAKATRTGPTYQQVQAIVAYYDKGETRVQYVARMLGITEAQVAAVFEEHGRRKTEAERDRLAASLRQRQKRERTVLKQVDASAIPYLRSVDRLVRGGGRR